MSLREKFRIFYSLVLAMLGFGKEEINLDEITKEDVVEGLLDELKDFAPSMATVLVDERNAYTYCGVHSVSSSFFHII
jgi:pheromone shutdown protein TraB